MVTVLAPVAYLAFLIGSLYTFSKVYRRRKAVAATSAQSWFPPHHERDVYISLLSMDPQPPESLLKAALLNRAYEDIKRLMRINQSKPALGQLLQKGQIGDDLWNQFLEAEKEHQAELLEVVQEANTFKEGWGQIIFASANDMVMHVNQKKVFESIAKELEGVDLPSLLNLTPIYSNRLLAQPPKIPDNIKITAPQGPNGMPLQQHQHNHPHDHDHNHDHAHQHPPQHSQTLASPAQVRRTPSPRPAVSQPSQMNSTTNNLLGSRASSVIEDNGSDAGTSDTGEMMSSTGPKKNKKRGKRKK